MDCGIQRKARNQYQVLLAECVCPADNWQGSELTHHPTFSVPLGPVWRDSQCAYGYMDPHPLIVIVTTESAHPWLVSSGTTLPSAWLWLMPVGVSQWGSRPHVTEPNPGPIPELSDLWWEPVWWREAKAFLSRFGVLHWPPHPLWHPVSSLLYLPENVRMNLSLTFWASWGHLGQVFWSQKKAHVVQTRFSPTQAEYCSGRMLILSFLRAWLSFFLLYTGTMSLFGPQSWRTLCENSFVVDPRSPSLTTNTDSRHGLPRPSPWLKSHSSPTTLHHQHWAHDTYHFSCLAFSGVGGGCCSSSCVSV